MSIDILIWIELRLSASFSIVGSSLIIYMIISDRKRKLARTYHRFMLLMSGFDVLQSIFMCIPSTNIFTCTAQGFFLVLGLAVPSYNASLNIYYSLIICRQVSSERFTNIEPIFHTVSILVPLSTALILTIIEDMERSMTVCSPSGDLSLIMLSSIISFCFLTCLISMICISYTVTSRAIKMRKYTSFNNARRRSHVDDDRKKTIKQAFSYFSAFVVTYTPLLLSALYRKDIEGTGRLPYFIRTLVGVFYPLQGFWNFFFFIRPGVQHVMKTNSDKSYLRAIKDVVFINNVIQSTSSRQNIIPDSPIEILVEDGLNHSTGEPKPEIERPRRLSLVYFSSMLNGEEDSDSVESVVEDGPHLATCKPKPEIERPRRLSLVHFSSMLNGEEDSDSVESLVEGGISHATCELKPKTERPR